MSDGAVTSIDTSRRAAFAEFWHYFAVNRGAVIGLWVFAALVLIAILAPLIAPHLPDQQYRDSFLVPPIWNEGGKSGFILGTDAVGRIHIAEALSYRAETLRQSRAA